MITIANEVISIIKKNTPKSDSIILIISSSINIFGYGCTYNFILFAHFFNFLFHVVKRGVTFHIKRNGYFGY